MGWLITAAVVVFLVLPVVGVIGLVVYLRRVARADRKATELS